MTKPIREGDRDEVLYAFHRAYDRPTADEIAEWVARYPQFAEDIRNHAAISWDWKATEARPVPILDQGMVDRGFSRVVDAIYKARLAAKAEPAVACESFHQLVIAAGTTIPKLAREWKIDRSILADLFNGIIRGPVARRLVRAFEERFRISVDAFNHLLDRAVASPRLGHAKASGTPAVRTRTYQEAIDASSMSADEKTYWLSEE